MDADPTHRCSRLASQQSERKGLPTDDTQPTEDTNLDREVALPTKKQRSSVASVATYSHFYGLHKFAQQLYFKICGVTENAAVDAAAFLCVQLSGYIFNTTR